MEDSYQDKRSGRLLRICKFILMLYKELQSYSKTSQWTQRKERMEMGRRIPKNIWRIEKQNHKLTGTCATKEKRNIQSRNKCFKTCNWRSLILGIGREMENHHIFIKDNASSQINYKIYDKKLLPIVEVITK